MKVLRALAAALVAFNLACLPAAGGTPEPSAQSDIQMTAASRHQLIEQLIQAVNDRYVFPDRAKLVEASLRAQQKRGAYDHVTSARKLSELLSQEMQATSRDRHLRVMFSEQAIPERKPQAEPTPDDVARRLAWMRSENFGVQKIEHLPFNIGYLDLVSFAPAKHAAETMAAAMTVLAHTDALIIDLRKNEGGDTAAAVLLASYLLDKRTQLNDFYYREGNRLEMRWSADVVPGLRYGQKKDVYVLTSKDTFSAAEDFTYALKNLKRVTVVGETTGGGAHPGDDIRLLPHFSAFMPLGRAISPITKTNWEGVGVTPDVSVCAGDAMRTAQMAILAKMAESEKDSYRLGSLKDRIAAVSADNTADAKCH